MAIGKNKFLGVVKKDNHKNTKWRHLDMRLVKMTSFPFAWSYFSSGKIFNKYIRQRIKKKGYLLNEYGIFKDGQRFNLAGEKTDIELEKEIKTENDLMQYAEGIEKEIFKLIHLIHLIGIRHVVNTSYITFLIHQRKGL